MVETTKKSPVELPVLSMALIMEYLEDSETLLDLRAVNKDFCQLVDLFRDGKLEHDSPFIKGELQLQRTSSHPAEEQK